MYFKVNNGGMVLGAGNQRLYPGASIEVGPDDIRNCKSNQLPKKTIEEHLASGYLVPDNTRNYNAQGNPNEIDMFRGGASLPAMKTDMTEGAIRLSNPSGIQTATGVPSNQPPGVSFPLGSARTTPPPGSVGRVPLGSSPRSRFNLDPDGIKGKPLDQLNVMIQDRLPEGERAAFRPYETPEEAIAHLSQDFNRP